MSKIKTASFLGFVAILTGLLNYITHPILIRYLSEGDYVQVGVYVSIIAILSIPASGFGSLMLELFRSDKSELFTSKNFQKELWKYSFFYGIFSIFGVFLGIFFLDLPISIMTVARSFFLGWLDFDCRSTREIFSSDWCDGFSI